jgi:hypothetical protein
MYIERNLREILAKTLGAIDHQFEMDSINEKPE